MTALMRMKLACFLTNLKLRKRFQPCLLKHEKRLIFQLNKNGYKTNAKSGFSNLSKKGN